MLQLPAMLIDRTTRPPTRTWRNTASLCVCFWFALSILAALIGRYPLIIHPVAYTTLIVGGIGNAILTALLLARPSPALLHRAGQLAGGIGWVITLGALGTFGRYPDTKAPGALLFAILAAGATSDWTTRKLRGFVGTVLAAEGALIVWIAAQWLILGVLTAGGAREQLLSWSVALGGATLISGVLIWNSQHTQRREMEETVDREVGQVKREDCDFRRWQVGLSRREAEVLDALLHGVAADRTNGEIARALYITENTLNKHKQEIGRKLGVDTGEREVIVAAALDQGLARPGVTPAPASAATPPARSGPATPPADTASPASAPRPPAAPERRSA